MNRSTFCYPLKKERCEAGKRKNMAKVKKNDKRTFPMTASSVVSLNYPISAEHLLRSATGNRGLEKAHT
jgi:hypothetical protein